jgi:hypothetical protein
MNSIRKIVALALVTGALATVGSTGNALAHFGGHYGGWHGGYGHHFGFYPHFYGVGIGYSPCYWVTRPEGLVKVCPGIY